MKRILFLVMLVLACTAPLVVRAQLISTSTATTTLDISICGNGIVDGNEQCDDPNSRGAYSTTIAGRQCSLTCRFAAYCGDGFLQSSHGEECDDGNNTNGDFCSALCKIQPASGGGGRSGGGSARDGGTSDELGSTLISLAGIGYPRSTINLLLDTESVGTVRTDSEGEFDFSLDAEPGTATLGMWSTDSAGVRSITLNNTFDVTQGAITNLAGVLIPPTIAVSNQEPNPGEVITVSGYAIPSATVEVVVGDDSTVVTSEASGRWSYELDTATLVPDEYIVRARSVYGTPPLTTESSYSTALQLFVGVDGSPTEPSDLNRDLQVNLTDFSILIFWWGTAGGNSNPPADINQNGNVGLEDFSILLFNWTG